MTSKTLKTLSTTELDILSDFRYQVANWQSNHGDDASTVKVEYSDDTGDFEISTSKASQGRTRRVSRLTADIIHWASGQLDNLEYQGIYAAKLSVSYQDGQFGIDFIPKPNQQSEHGADEPSDEPAVSDDEQDGSDVQS